MKIVITSLMVDDQAKALAFYTEKLGFQKEKDIPLGAFRWLTVVSPEGAHGVELLLEPMGHPAAAPFQKALFDSNTPATSFGSDDVRAEFERLSQKGVVFRKPPTKMGPVTIAVFDDTCGNLIQIAQGG